MPNPPTRQIFLPNYKLNITVPAEYSDDQIADAIQRNKTQIQQASPVYAQGQKYLQNGLGPDDAGNGLKVPGLGISEQQARTQGVGPAVQAAQDATQYNHTDQLALLRHYQAVRAINSANQHPNAAQIVAHAQANLLPTERLTAIGDRATRAVNDVVNTPLLNPVLDYGAPGASQQLEQMQGYGAGLARGVLGFSSPGSLGAMAVLGPVGAEPMGAKMLLGAFGAPAVSGAYRRAVSGDVGGALGELTAFGLPFALHVGRLAQEAKNAADYRAGARWMDANYGVDADPAAQPLLRPGPDPNIYEADFRPDRPTAPASADLALPLDRSAYLQRLPAAPDAQGLAVDPVGEITRQTQGAMAQFFAPSASSVSAPATTTVPPVEVTPSSFAPESIQQVADAAQVHLGISPAEAQDFAHQVLLEEYRPSRQPATDPLSVSDNSLAPTVVALDSTRDGAQAAESAPATVPQSPEALTPANAAHTTPLTLTAAESLALADVMGQNHPISRYMDQAFSDGRDRNTFALSAPSQVALRGIVEQTKSLPGSYSRLAMLQRIEQAAQSLHGNTNASGTAGIMEGTTVRGGQSDGRQLDARPAETGTSPGETDGLSPAERKRAGLTSAANSTDAGDVGRGVGSYPVADETGSRTDTGSGSATGGSADTRGRLAPASRSGLAGWSAEGRSPSGHQAAHRGGFFLANRDKISGTEASGKLSVRFWAVYKASVGKDTDQHLGQVRDCFHGQLRAALESEVPKWIIDTPVVVVPTLDAEDAGTITLGQASRYIKDDGTPDYEVTLNGEYREDPAELVRTLLEEVGHLLQVWRGDVMDDTLPYEERPHEIDAKAFADRHAGYPHTSRLYVRVNPTPPQSSSSSGPLLPRRAPGSPSKNAGIIPETTAGGQNDGRQPDTVTMQEGASGGDEGGAELTPTQRKRARIDALRGGNDGRATLGKVGEHTANPGDAGGDRTGSGSLSRVAEGVPRDGTRPNQIAEQPEVESRRAREVNGSVEKGARGGVLAEAPRAELPAPRPTITGTEAEGHLSPEWFHGYRGYVLDGTPAEEHILKDVFQGETLRRAERAFQSVPEVLHSPVVLHENLPDDMIGTIQPNSRSLSGWDVVLNGRTIIDPADIGRVISEEAMHIAWKMKGRSFDMIPPYEQRIHEITAKAGATHLAGRDTQYDMITSRGGTTVRGGQSDGRQLDARPAETGTSPSGAGGLSPAERKRVRLAAVPTKVGGDAVADQTQRRGDTRGRNIAGESTDTRRRIADIARGNHAGWESGDRAASSHPAVLLGGARLANRDHLRGTEKEALLQEEKRTSAAKYIVGDDGDVLRSPSPTLPHATVADAEAAAKKLGVTAKYGQDLTIANTCSQMLSELQERKLPLPEKIIVSAEKFKYSPDGAIARAEHNAIVINPGSSFWANPTEHAKFNYGRKFWSTDHPLHVLRHEAGHLAWEKRSPIHYRNSGSADLKPDEITEAASVSRRAYPQVDEFISEVFAALLDGRQVIPEVMKIYRKYGGPKI
ncbi:MAG: phage head morphosis protein [Chthonomonadaceae bacterium]|nr:phage head morphosis protein [Chthonomonadaceae bacterium]